ncbi:MAG: LamG-like jellyroll fold domain-containing protein [Candidatus Paceibacterota bacterium]|jgi:prepilin-type N-terminal cleavage/methylation domain-containing protein
MNKIIKQAFTLIELLVVIAIIGILSGLIVVSMSSVTQKANIAKAQVFSNSLRNSLMANIVTEWKFDGLTIDGSAASDNDVLDTWGGTNNGNVSLSLLANRPIVKRDSNCVSGSCLYFDGADYVTIAPFNYAEVNDFSIGAWVNWSGFSGGNFAPIYLSYTSSTSTGIEIGMGGSGNFIWDIRKSGNIVRRQYTSDIVVPKNIWKYVTVTKIGDNDVVIYIDGVKNMSTRIAATQNSIAEGYFIGRQVHATFPDWIRLLVSLMISVYIT